MGHVRTICKAVLQEILLPVDHGGGPEGYDRHGAGLGREVRKPDRADGHPCVQLPDHQFQGYEEESHQLLQVCPGPSLFRHQHREHVPRLLPGEEKQGGDLHVQGDRAALGKQ